MDPVENGSTTPPSPTGRGASNRTIHAPTRRSVTVRDGDREIRRACVRSVEEDTHEAVLA